MSMTVLLELQLRSDLPTETVETAIRETLAQTGAFAGNESLEVIVDDADPTRVVVVERWTTSADHDAYVAWRATPEGASALRDVVASPPVKRTFDRTISLT
ncbi:antibiotic biosynthesis monooxygenase family protein [Curtobacterium sp. MCPF17_002]|jgi:quinol monooxygenase YgiN|uniref:putative quinol monooxygenase n=1 Tax=Curtobacterium sp. MCPF17_002 TaxID=2175645 RepID=UPI000DAA4CF7|nr:antibiotic biosynthesis monooxygenase family protein [Curtobacterium sp. MCPF17_002]WIB76148.1 antibiotic biosynthesis monooxygenase family protein [Curtobacterium sp. MCPF17_002]